MEKDIYIRSISCGSFFCDGFNYSAIKDSVVPNPTEDEILKDYLLAAFNNRSLRGNPGAATRETLFICVACGGSDALGNDAKYAINLDAKFKYIDFIELKEARKNAREAKRMSTWAIIISLVSIAVSVVATIFDTQIVKIDSNQFEQLTQ
ncbi:MAG: hypothetical protein Q7S96_04585 [bacterium]|nr:hypothetical protein [bacterium]